MRIAGKSVVLLALVLAACGGGGTAEDAGTDARAADLGGTDLDAPDLASGDAGCTTDADGDGHRSTACGGDDCDDADPNRYPGNREVCDATNHDEDCDPRTFGFRDGDMDGYADALCCNVGATGMNCGTDCNDAAPAVHPTANETCNGMDDDCNGVVDDVTATVYLDCDGDGFGDPARSRSGCPHAAAGGECTSPASGAGWIAMGGDCNDGAATVHPGATEVCNMVDDDCNALIDDVAGGGCACTPPANRACGTMVGACHVGTQSCIAGHWETACGGAYVGPSSESCNGVDDDCDGVVDDGVGTVQYADADGDGYGAGPAVTACALMTGYVTRNGDCGPTDPAVHPGGAQSCMDHTSDGDCDGIFAPDDPDTDAWCTALPHTTLMGALYTTNLCGSVWPSTIGCTNMGVHCAAGWADCNASDANVINTADGCETATTTDTDCLACGHVCTGATHCRSFGCSL